MRVHPTLKKRIVSVYRKIFPLAKAVDAAIAKPFSQKTSHKLNLIVSLSLLLGIFVIFKSLGIVASSPPPILPGEIDLSGPWKISLSDRVEFSRKNFNDKNWCYTGVPDPSLSSSAPNSHCPSNYYPADKMRGHTYWYRKSIHIPIGAKWKEPSLFLGAIKHKAWIYWDGELVGISNFKNGTGITTVQLEKSIVTPGEHVLAIRVSSLEIRYPGIFHAYPRKVTLGEVDGNISQYKKIIDNRYIFPALSIFIQIAGLLLTILLLALGKGSGTQFFWLSIYFFATTVLSAKQFGPHEHASFIARLSIIVTSFSVFGSSLRFHSWISDQIHLASRALFILMLCSVGVFLILFSTGEGLNKNAHLISLTIALAPFLAFGISALKNLKSKVSSREHLIDSWATLFSLLVLCGLHSLNFANEFLFSKMPIITEHPSFKSALSIALVATMIYQYIEQERTLAFFGRFIRPGLKTLLRENFQKKNFADEKVFRPRKIAILKIDIVGHTETTFQMPYGIKRLFQDTWFTTIDQVVADKVFMDKNVGDGSIYCFSEEAQGGSCLSALNAAIRIRDETLHRFDMSFSNQLKIFISVTPELRGPAEAFFESYHQRTGVKFEDRQTKTRIALVFGYVDEGLWGLTSQSHYDVQGDLVSLAARIESKAKENEILMDEAFVKECHEHLAGEKISPRLESLKGMGEVKVYSLQASSTLISAA